MRTVTLNPSTDSLIISMTLVRGEHRRILLTGMGADNLLMTISDSARGVPLIEIVGVGQLNLLPEITQVLVEDVCYYFNIWQKGLSDQLAQVASGTLIMNDAIVPEDATFSTTFLNRFGQSGGITQIIFLTQSQYNALSVKDATTLYMITGAA